MMQSQILILVLSIVLIILICYYYIHRAEVLDKIVPDMTKYPPAPKSPRRRPGVLSLT